MKIDGFEVGPYTVKDEGGKRHLIFDCRDCVYGSSISDDPHCRYHVQRVLSEVEADLIVLAEVYERVYNEQQTKLLAGLANVLKKFEIESIWSYDHLGDVQIEGETHFGERHDALVNIAHDVFLYDPIAAYLRLLQEISRERVEVEKQKPNLGKTYSDKYLATLAYIKKNFESAEFIQRSKAILLNLKEVPDTANIYKSFFEVQLKPSFIGSRLMFEEMETLELLDEYTVKDATVQIFKHPNKTEKLYFINTPEYSLPPEKYFIVSKTKEVVAAYQPGRVSLSGIARSRKYFERVYQSTINDIAKANNIVLTQDEVTELAGIVARYTVGYGILELILSDRKITDVYLDAPIGVKSLYVVHSDYGQCQTNVIYSPDEASAFISKLRAMSSRPFDEAHPVLDYDLPDLDTRVALIGQPLSPDGPAFAFRLHKITPWTLPQFIDAKFLSPTAAGLMSFFIDNQSTMLVTGSRGSGKTSLMGALILEILQNARIIVQEDSVTGDSSIVVERMGKIERTTVGQLIDELIEKYGALNHSGREVLFANPEEIRVYSLDRDGKTRFAPVSQFMRHKTSKELYEVVTRSGRKIKVTSDHSLFGLMNNEILPVRTSELKIGSHIAIPRTLPWENAHLDEIDLFERIITGGKGYLCSESIPEFIIENHKKVRALASKRGYSKSLVSAWKRNKVLPVRIVSNLDCLQLRNESLKFKMDRKSKPIPIKIKLSDGFLNFIGLWLADGSYDTKYGTIISTPDCFGTVDAVARQFDLRARNHSDGFSYIISNVNLNFILRTFMELNGNSRTKKFPSWVYSLSKDQINQVLKGLFSGDGCATKNEVVLGMISKSIIGETAFFLNLSGVISRHGSIEKRRGIINLRISGNRMLNLFQKDIGFLQERKQELLSRICGRISTHDNTDIIPISHEGKAQVLEQLMLSKYEYISRGRNLGRAKFTVALSSVQNSKSRLVEKLAKLLDSEVFWDEIKEINPLGAINGFVYDFSVPECENFICENIIAHNTMEIAVPYMKNIGFNIQRMKTRSPISVSKSETEVAPEEALRTALRLGDSAIIVGEVRSKEAKVLYEAMRVGAAGNIVMGTIHGDSAYSVWDRVVNDLGVPNTSFKATDIVAVARPIRFGGSMKRNRRVVQITEVKKHWTQDPEAEGGLLDIMAYDAKKDTLELMEDNLKESDIFSKVSGLSGLTMQEIWKSINTNAESKKFLVDLKNEFKIPDLLEAESYVALNNKYMLMREDQIEQYGEVDYTQLIGEWKNWVRNNYLKRFMKKMKPVAEK